ncbi:MAG: MFS transporter [Candidatus Acinetobacter avistercoris]|uniref:MFS transporter n=1 Tax=Acinetobacter sp. KS-LM10 TaxID=3120518 RepID=UPI001F8FF5A2|nr:MFS transporter [Candidatus Acinetobacter avistercoris]
MNIKLWQPFIIVSLALCLGTIGTALASPLYPLYQQLWELMPSDITLIFVAYMFGCLTTLLFFGRTSNTIGYIKTMQIGLVFIIVGLLFSMFATHFLWLSVGRFIIGIASGLMTTAALLGLIQTVPEQHKQIAPQLSSIIIAIGFGLGPLVGGVIAQFSQAPLVTPYIPIVMGSFLCLISLFSLKGHHFTPQPFSFTPKLLRPEKQHHAQFWIICLTAFCIFAAFSLFASLSPSFLKDILPWDGPLVSGIAITSILFISAAVQFLAKYLPPIKSLTYGLLTSLCSLIILILSIWLKISLFFVISDVLFGIGHGLSLLGAFGLIHQMTTHINRAAVMSTYLFIGYLGTIIPIIFVGYLADHFGLNFGVITFCLIISMMLLCLYFSQLKIIPIQSKRSA